VGSWPKNVTFVTRPPLSFPWPAIPATDFPASDFPASDVRATEFRPTEFRPTEFRPPISVPPSSVHRFPSHHSFFRRDFCLSAYFMFDFDKNRAESQGPRRESPSLHDAFTP
jgi:hypothetical protein